MRVGLAYSLRMVTGRTVANHDRISSSDGQSFIDQDPTPRTPHALWKLTTSLQDVRSYVSNIYANTAWGYYAPTSEKHSMLFHLHARYLQTPTLTLGGMGTPLSMPNSGGALYASANDMDLSGFQTLKLHQHHHVLYPSIRSPTCEHAFAPSSFVHQDTGYETMEPETSGHEASPPDQRVPSMPVTILQEQQLQGSRTTTRGAFPPSAETFHLHSTLNAPTAMVRHADDVPITYLNKGQIYSLTVTDTSVTGLVAPGTKYRTFVRVSFEEHEQRENPGVCWGLWKEGRGTSEAHHRGGKLQAVEYVEASQSADMNEKKTKVELENYSFDGFCVVWSTGVSSIPEANIRVRFNFLSTDFSRSKGIKGIPLRFCAKTIPVLTEGTPKDGETHSEVWFCKVKLFRDHGAERKLSHDIAHIEKLIGKVKRKLALIESGMKGGRKPKRMSDALGGGDSQRPGKIQKHKRTWLMSPASSSGSGTCCYPMMEDDLQVQLLTLQGMFTSTRPVTVLCLRGEDLDDPDLHPVSLPGGLSSTSQPDATKDGPCWQPRTTKSSASGPVVPPSPRSIPLASRASGMWGKIDSAAAASGRIFEQLSRVNRMDDIGNLDGWIEALGVDPSYRPPTEQVEKSVACFYVQYENSSESDKPSYHRAVYLAKRTIEEFTSKIAIKGGIDPTKVVRMLCSVQGGPEVEMDQDVFGKLREGQDMRLRIEEIREAAKPAKREREIPIDDNNANEEPISATSRSFALHLVF